MEKIKKFCRSVIVDDKTNGDLGGFNKLCISIIFLDAILIFLETFEQFKPYEKWFQSAIWIITGFFALEYVIRIIGHKNKIKFAKSFYGLIDLFSFLPILLTLGMLDVGYIRVFRLFKFLKFTKYIKSAKTIFDSISAIKDQLIGFFMIGGSVIYVFAVSMFHFENAVQPEKIKNVFDALYLAVITLTTLGYGDITPLTSMGKVFTGLFAVISILFITIPTSLFIYEYTKRMDESSSPKKSENNSLSLVENYKKSS